MTHPYCVGLLEYHVANHCNLKCDQCGQFSPFFSALDSDFTHSISPSNFEKQLSILAPHLHARRFGILGGEPLLQKQLLDFLVRLRESMIADQIALVTNGILLMRQPDALFSLVDHITISYYISHPLSDETITAIRKRCEAADVEVEIVRRPVFSRRVVGKNNADPSLVNDIFQTCTDTWVTQCFTIQDGYLYRCSFARLAGYQLYQQGLVDRDFHEDDGLKLTDSSDFGNRVRSYLTPLKSCSYCLGSVGKLVKHRQMNIKDIDEHLWTCRTIANSIDRWRAFEKFTFWRLFKKRYVRWPRLFKSVLEVVRFHGPS